MRVRAISGCTDCRCTNANSHATAHGIATGDMTMTDVTDMTMTDMTASDMTMTDMTASATTSTTSCHGVSRNAGRRNQCGAENCYQLFHFFDPHIIVEC
jgi:hypothetical protein